MTKIKAKTSDLAAAAKILDRAGLFLSKEDCPISLKIRSQLFELERQSGKDIEQAIERLNHFDAAEVEIELKDSRQVFIVRMALGLVAAESARLIKKVDISEGAL